MRNCNSRFLAKPDYLEIAAGNQNSYYLVEMCISTRQCVLSWQRISCQPLQCRSLPYDTIQTTSAVASRRETRYRHCAPQHGQMIFWVVITAASSQPVLLRGLQQRTHNKVNQYIVEITNYVYSTRIFQPIIFFCFLY